MAFDPKVKALARRAYVFERLTLEQAAERVGVSFPTLRRWKREAEAAGDDWDKVRDVQIMAGGDVESVAKGLLAGFLIQYKTVMQELEESELASADKVGLLSSLADSFAKMTASSKKLLPTTSELATGLKVIEMMAEEVKQHKPELLEDFMALFMGLQTRFEQEFK